MCCCSYWNDEIGQSHVSRHFEEVWNLLLFRVFESALCNSSSLLCEEMAKKKYVIEIKKYVHNRGRLECTSAYFLLSFLCLAALLFGLLLFRTFFWQKNPCHLFDLFFVCHTILLKLHDPQRHLKLNEISLLFFSSHH